MEAIIALFGLVMGVVWIIFPFLVLSKMGEMIRDQKGIWKAQKSMLSELDESLSEIQFRMRGISVFVDQLEEDRAREKLKGAKKPVPKPQLDAEAVRRVLETAQIDTTELAARLDITAQRWEKILEGKEAIDDNLARVLERETGISASFWLGNSSSEPS